MFKGRKKMPEKVLVCYTFDTLEETVAVADNVSEMSRFINKSVPNLVYSIKHNSPMKYSDKRVKFEWVTI